VEAARGAKIPDWAYRDVLVMLIHYTIAAFELLDRKMTAPEKEEAYNVFLRIGRRMNIPELPERYSEWLPLRQAHLQNNLARSRYTDDLFQQYKKQLGVFRYIVLREAQVMVAPKTVASLLGFKNFSILYPIIPVYKCSRWLNLDKPIKWLLLPPAYKKQIEALDVVPS
jgi:hypothetical protein